MPACGASTLAISGVRIGAALGEGSAGTVYEAVNAAGDALALKVLHPALADDPEMVKRFRREAEICHRLRSPHIAQVVGAGRQGSAYWIAYRRVPGETLQAKLDRQRVLSMAELTPLVDHLLLGLAAAHAAGVVHRDVKPSNLMIEATADGPRLCILDFGFGKDRSTHGATSTGLTSATATLGTVDYMPPEQVDAAASAGPRADLYSAAVVAYRAVSGRLPHVGDSQASVLQAKISEEARTLEQATGLPWPGAFETFFERALRARPAHRFADAAAMREAWNELPHMGRPPSADELRANAATETDASTAT